MSKILVSKARDLTSGYRGIVVEGVFPGATMVIWECQHKHRLQGQAIACAEKKIRRIKRVGKQKKEKSKIEESAK